MPRQWRKNTPNCGSLPVLTTSESPIRPNHDQRTALTASASAIHPLYSHILSSEAYPPPAYMTVAFAPGNRIVFWHIVPIPIKK